MKLGILGATGLVGQHFLKLLEQDLASSSCPKLQTLKLFSQSQKACSFLGKTQLTQVLKKDEAPFKGLDICFFSAGSKVSHAYAQQAVRDNCIVIDNSSAFRQDPDKLLIVPEVNGNLLKYKPQIIANPNCSTIPLTCVLQLLHQAFKLQSVQVVSLQSISGAGKQALNQLKQESLNILQNKLAYEQTSMTSAFNCLPHIGDILDDGFCTEENKIMQETKKILQLPKLPISAFTVRVPSLNSHSLVVRLSLQNTTIKSQDIISVLSQKHIIVQNDSKPPHARMASGKREIIVGRIHKDSFGEGSWLLWLVSDNLLKGASLNGLQIAKQLLKIQAS